VNWLPPGDGLEPNLTGITQYHYEPETKQQPVERRQSGSPRPQKFRVQKSAGKVLASLFWDQDGFLLIIFQRAKLSTSSITHLCWRN